MTLPINRTAKTALDTNLVNGITSDAPKVKASNDVLYNTIDELNGKVDSHTGAPTLAHPDGSVTTAKLADGAVTAAKISSLPANSVGTSQIIDYAVTAIKVADASLTAAKFAPGALNNDTQNGLRITTIANKPVIRNYGYRLPNENYNINFANIPDSNLTVLDKLKVVNGSTCNISNGSLFVNGRWHLGYNPVQINVNPENKILRFKLKTPNIYPTVVLRHNDDYSQRFSVWVGSGDKKIGLGVLGKTNAVIQDMGKSTWLVSTTEDIWLEIICGLVETGETITINYWTEALGYSGKQTFSYTFLSTDTKVKTGKITFGTQIDPIQIDKIHLYDGIEYQNKLKEQFYFCGRWFSRWLNGKDTMTTINNGSAIYCKVKGTTSINANFEFVTGVSAPTIGFSLNGGNVTKVSASSVIGIGSSLDPTKEYIVKIFASSIYWKNGCWDYEKGLSFSGLTVNGGATIEPYFPQNKRIMFFGDSIANGCTMNGTSETLLSNSAGELAFPHIVCRELNALPLQCGYAGTGLTKKSSDNMDTMMVTVDYKSVSQLNTDEIPDILVINTGTNDTGTDAVAWEGLYKILIDKFIQRFGNIPIFICDGFTKRNFTAQMQDLVSQYKNLLYIDTSSVTIPTTDGTHPTAQGHENVGVFIANFIRNNLAVISF